MINKIGPIHSDRRKNRMDAIVARNSAQNRVAKDVKNKEKVGKVTTNDRKTFDAGTEWFDFGFALEEADEKLRNNPNFIAGFNYGMRIQYVNQLSYETGIEWFNKGVELDEIPENYKNNEYFMNGYNSCNGRSK